MFRFKVSLGVIVLFIAISVATVNATTTTKSCSGKNCNPRNEVNLGVPIRCGLNYVVFTQLGDKIYKTITYRQSGKVERNEVTLPLPTKTDVCTSL